MDYKKSCLGIVCVFLQVRPSSPPPPPPPPASLQLSSTAEGEWALRRPNVFRSAAAAGDQRRWQTGLGGHCQHERHEICDKPDSRHKPGGVISQRGGGTGTSDSTYPITANTTHWAIAGSLLDQRRRRWPNTEPALAQCIIFAGILPC